MKTAKVRVIYKVASCVAFIFEDIHNLPSKGTQDTHGRHPVCTNTQLKESISGPLRFPVVTGHLPVSRLCVNEASERDRPNT